MELKLRVIGGKNAGKDVPIQVKRFFIGRAEDCHLRPGSEMISRHHCVLINDEGYAAVRDLGSKNGTLINGQRVAGEQELHAGDVLQVGPLEFEVRLAPHAAPQPTAPTQPAAAGAAANPTPATPTPAAATERKPTAAPAATGSTGGRDIDISEWLSEEQPAPDATTALHDTHHGRAGDTQIGSARLTSLPAEETTAGAAESPEADPASDQPPAPHIDPAKRTPGKLPPIPKQTAKDSRDAAAKILDQMRRRNR